MDTNKKQKTFLDILSEKREKFNITENCKKVLESRYLKKKDGKVIETPEELFRRVAKAISEPEQLYSDKYSTSQELTETLFYNMMGEGYFLPNSPTLMNAGRNNGHSYSACFVLPIEDSIDGIFTSIKNTAIIQKAGGGTGFHFGSLRPKGSEVRSSGGTTSGPISFLKVFSEATNAIQQGAFRRGANMGVMIIDHPDILEFIEVKKDLSQLTNYNLSVAVTDEFMHKLRKEPNSPHIVKNNDNGKEYPLESMGKTWSVNDVWELILERAWQTGEPGILFIDEINKYNPTPHIGKIEATNPCLSGDTWVFTEEGPKQINELLGEQTNLYLNGELYSTTEKGFFSQGKKELYLLETKEGYSIKLTKDHKMMDSQGNMKPASEFKEGDLLKISLNNSTDWEGEGGSEGEGYLLGLLMGDGHINNEKAILGVWKKEGEEEGEEEGKQKIMDEAFKYAMQMPHRKDFKGWRKVKDKEEYKMCLGYLKKVANNLDIVHKNKTITPKLEKLSSSFYKGFLRGFFDTDGSVQGNKSVGRSIRLSQSDISILESVQRMLSRFGISSKIYKFRRKEQKRLLPDQKGGHKEYLCKAQHELCISNENISNFIDIIGFTNTDHIKKFEDMSSTYKRELKEEAYLARFSRLTYIGEEEVFDCQVPGPHKFEANSLVSSNCGEVNLLPYEACNLGSINLSKFVEKNKNGESFFNFDKFKTVIHLSTRFLDNIIDANNYPIPEIDEICKNNRKIGLGVMGLADALFMLGIKYDSDEGVSFGEDIMKFIKKESHLMSTLLSETRGNFPNWKGSTWEKEKKNLRNASVTCIAPTGTISIIANCSGGIEPMFSLAFTRNVLNGQKLTEVNPIFEKVAKERGFYSKELIQRIASEGTLQNIEEIPEDIKRIFVTARDITPDWHVKMQAAFQRHTDNSISKTINFDNSASKEDIKKVYDMAFDYNLKGCTIYRDGCRSNQPMALEKKKEEKKIVRYEVKTKTPSPLPEVLNAVKIRQFTPFGNLHLCISVDPKTNKEVEVFAQLGKSGEIISSDLEAICRLISRYLRIDGDIKDVVSQLKDIGSSLTIPSEQGKVKSLADGIAKGIEKYLESKKDMKIKEYKVSSKKTTSATSDAFFVLKCPECEANMTLSEGCMTCRSCGYSKC